MEKAIQIASQYGAFEFSSLQWPNRKRAGPQIWRSDTPWWCWLKFM